MRGQRPSIGHVLDFDEVITFESDRADEIEAEFHRSVDTYLALCQAVFRQVPVPHNAGESSSLRARGGGER